eukprot:6031032-Amphidinium_carterae.1
MLDGLMCPSCGVRKLFVSCCRLTSDEVCRAHETVAGSTYFVGEVGPNTGDASFRTLAAP